MPNPYFEFREFTVHHERSAMKVGTDSILIGAWAGKGISVPSDILDIGSGNGLISLMMAQRFGTRVVGVEIDENSYLESLRNVRNSKFRDLIEMEHNTFQLFANRCREKFDLIVSNPPFFHNAYKSGNVSRNMARHDDSLSPADITAGVARILAPQGHLALILPPASGEELTELLSGHGIYPCKKTLVRGQPGRPVKRWLLEFSRSKTVVHQEELVLENSQHGYSEDYKALVKDFYLRV